MKAAVVTQPGKLEVQDIPVPVPGEYEVLCENLYGATCTATDLHLIHGTFPFGTQYPTILGHESVGRVTEIGDKVRHYKIGDVITRAETRAHKDSKLNINWGGFVEFSLAVDHRAMKEDGLPKQKWKPFTVQQVVPNDIDPRAATMFITWRETLSYAQRMEISRAKSLLVIGTGGTALSFIVHARNVGVGSITSIGNPSRESLFRSAGTTAFHDYRSEDLSGAVAAMQPDGFEFIIDSVGKKGLADTALPWLQPGGTLGIYGIDDYNSITLHPMKARGSFTVYKGGYDQAEVHDQVVELTRNGKLDASLWLDLDNPFELAAIGDAYDVVEKRELVKALVRIRGSSTGV